MLSGTIFRFKGCLRAPKPRSPLLRASYATTLQNASQDDQALVPLFDQVKSNPNGNGLEPITGLFHHPLLRHPSQFKIAATLTVNRAQRLVDRIANAPSVGPSEMRKVVKNLDRLSDLLCSVIDLSELVRSAHPEPVWSESANEAYEMLCEFMAVLNTHVGLSNTLKQVLADQSIVKDMSTEEYQTGLVFWRDFVRSGLDLSPSERDRFVSLSSEILTLGRTFLNGVATPRRPAILKPDEIVGTGGGAIGRMKIKAFRRVIEIQPGTQQAHIIMQSPEEDAARRKIYMASNSSTREQEEVLNRLLQARAELAMLGGKESFSHMVLEDKMAKSPENVQQFLDMRMLHTRPRANEAVQLMSFLKMKALRLQHQPQIYAWDREAFATPARPSPPIPIRALTAGRVFMGLSRLFKHLYGLSLRPADILVGEVWHSDVRKLEVVHEDEGVIGWIYVDLYRRVGKAAGAAHYTVVCSRRTDDDDEPGDFTAAEIANGPSIETMREMLPFNRYKVQGRPGTYQLPMAVLLFDFPRPYSDRSATLEWQDVLTICHEMGHAMHSMLGRTNFQNVSGTRCATDFVELPSILMEYFLTSPTVISLFTDNNTTHPIQSPQDTDNTFAVLDSHTQLLLSYMDQIYHSTLPLEPSFDSTTTYAELLNSKSPIPYAPGTSWQTQFGHLYSYGAQYYSYMLDRAIAGRVWHKLFAKNPLDRQAGEKFRSSVLVHGGGKDPWEMVGDVLDQEELKEGDAAAMKEVGRWSVEDDVAATMRL
ncbi:hypothetical protein M422DRAFT_191609 [Sphaerobolus stellatus SS14]|uniref:Mitochondrial intermediate peptidase n=1 Tax=Sphaerobolus stellatus (strain SS14) TaxID=990650 RepID=A0A0C9TCN4_SPHS4|nr:hypothetical protein M422DRAFT_191609 [Sphaerobolus stellatus SS14]